LKNAQKAGKFIPANLLVSIGTIINIKGYADTIFTQGHNFILINYVLLAPYPIQIRDALAVMYMPMHMLIALIAADIG